MGSGVFSSRGRVTGGVFSSAGGKTVGSMRFAEPSDCCGVDAAATGGVSTAAAGRISDLDTVETGACTFTSTALDLSGVLAIGAAGMAVFCGCTS